MKRTHAPVASYFNASSMEALKMHSGEKNYNAVVLMINRLLAPYSDENTKCAFMQFPITEIPKYEGGDEHIISFTFRRTRDCPIIIGIHSTIMACYSYAERRPLRVVCNIKIGDDENDEIVTVRISPMTMMANSGEKKMRLVRQKSFSERIMQRLMPSAVPDETEMHLSWDIAKSHLPLMRIWVADKGVSGTVNISAEVTNTIAAYICAGIRATDTTWQIERIERYGCGHSAIPNGWLESPKTCVGIFIGVRDDDPLPTFDVVIIDECVGYLREEENIDVQVGIRSTSDGLVIFAALL